MACKECACVLDLHNLHADRMFCLVCYRGDAGRPQIPRRVRIPKGPRDFLVHSGGLVVDRDVSGGVHA